MWNIVQKLMVVLLIVASLRSGFRQWQSTINIDKGSSALEKWEERLKPVRETLPIKRGVIGFVSEWNIPGLEHSFADQETEFILTQYALAPLILVNGPVAEWNVAILNNKALKMWEEANPGQFEIIPLKHGVYLLHRRDEQ